MSIRTAVRRHTLPLLIFAGFLSGCTSSVEGKYYNADTGQMVMELKGGKLMMAGGMGAMNADYKVRGDSIVLSDPSGGGAAVSFAIRKDGSIDGGALGILKKK